MLDVFCRTPTGNQYGPPSTSFSSGQHPLGAAPFGSLRSPSLHHTQRVFGEAAASAPRRRAHSRGRQQNKLQKDFYTPAGCLRKVWVFEFRIHPEPSLVQVEFDQRLMAKLLHESRKKNPVNEDERVIASENSDIKSEIDPVHVEAVRSKLLNVDPQRFEYLLRDLLAKTGYAQIEVTQYSQDGGVDLNAHTLQPRQLWAMGDWLVQIQAKRWIHTVGRKEVAELRGSLKPFALGTIITTSHFSKAAILESKETGKNPIHLVDGYDLSRTIIEANATNIV
jgi:HJR/Mrr/RecB family endonuclease